MLSKVNKRILIALVDIGSYCWASPMSYNVSLKQSMFCVTARNYNRFLILLVIWCLNHVHLSWKLFHLFNYSNFNPTDFSVFEPFWKLFFTWILTGSVTIILLTFSWNRHIIVNFTNDWIGLFEYFQGFQKFETFLTKLKLLADNCLISVE